MNKKNNLLITGIPRSGTSLLTKLLSESNNVLCLSEPSWLKDIRHEHQKSSEFVHNLLDQIEHIRDEIRRGNPVAITVKKGSSQVPDNYFTIENNKQSNLKDTLNIHVEHSTKLTIIIKSNTLFTAQLEHLKNNINWNIVGVVRNPLFVLMSWRKLNIPISRGQIKIGEIYSESIREIVREKNLLIKQVKILNWFFQSYFENKINTIKYENLIKDTASIIELLLGIETSCSKSLLSSNSLQRYRSDEKDTLLRTLLAYCPMAKVYYPENF